MLNFLHRWRALWDPNRYHGWGRRRNYFEGWYFKIVDPTERYAFAIIPGISMDQDGNRHAFIQVLDGKQCTAAYHNFPAEAFLPASTHFEVQLGPNRFSDGKMELELSELRGKLHLKHISPWPRMLGAPGIMGWYSFVPFMECYHGVVSLDHALYGALEVDGAAVDFGGGRGYIEKDWGQSFPQAWVWLQSNHFAQAGVCLTGSIAIIPWRRTSFNGFIVGLWVDGRLYRFATYTGAEVAELTITDDAVQWVLRDKSYQLSILAQRGPASHVGLLKGPTTLEMGKRVEETLTATVEVALHEVGSGREVFAGYGRCAGLEVYNPAALLGTRI